LLLGRIKAPPISLSLSLSLRSNVLLVCSKMKKGRRKKKREKQRLGYNTLNTNA
jgi:hypothetical protein